MIAFDVIKFSLSASPVLLIVLLLLLFAYTVYVYKYTIPALGKGKRIFLISLRTLAIFLILFLVFEPDITLGRKSKITPVPAFFFDNSKSMTIKDGQDRSKQIKEAINKIYNEFNGKADFYLFGDKLLKLNNLNQLTLDRPVTNFTSIFSGYDRSKDYSSFVIISDGNLTEGTNPVFSAEKLLLPVFTLGIGDTTLKKDIVLTNVVYNDLMYINNPAEISASIKSNGYENKDVNISLIQGTQVIENKQIKLTSNTQNISLTFTPLSGGEKKLAVVVSPLKDEFSKTNNSQSFFVNVLDNKIKVAIISGAPSSDLSFIKNSLEANKNFSVNTITQLSGDRFVERNNRESIIDSAQIYYLIGFPSKETSSNILNRVIENIGKKDKSYFYIFNDQVDVGKLKALADELPVSISGLSGRYIEVQPKVKSDNPVIGSNKNNWENLPPVLQPEGNYKVKAESEVIAYAGIRNSQSNIPLIVTKKLGNKRGLIVLAKDIWKWKLQVAERNLDILDNLVDNSVRWLNTNNLQKQVKIRTSKKIYSKGEVVELTAQVYDESFNPVNNAEVKVNINSKNRNDEVSLNGIGSGLYEGKYETDKAGDYSFSGTAKANNKTIGTDKGMFNIGDIDIEMNSINMDKEFLNNISYQTKGKFYFYSQLDNLIAKVKQNNQKFAKEKLEVNEVKLWNNEYLLSLILLLFSTEWFFRKRWGLL